MLPSLVLEGPFGAVARRKLAAVCWWCLLVGLLAAPATADVGCVKPVETIDEVSVRGNAITREATLLALLPRPSPSRYSLVELRDFERRLRNLGIFDQVLVRCEGRVLGVQVREKWTLVPEVDFSSGQSLEDSYALLGATEYNLFGSANQLSVNAFRQQRGLGATVAFAEHRYRQHRWSLYADVSLSTADLRFEDGSEWKTASAALELNLSSPPWLHRSFNYVPGLILSREVVYSPVNAVPPPDSQLIQPYMGFIWDAYSWHDLVPTGLRAKLWLTFGGLFGRDPPLPRHTIEFTLDAALRLDSLTALVSRLDAGVGTRGNVNYSFLVGSVEGVRGLRDAYYFTWAQLVESLELRRSVRLGERWALQGVLFADAAIFETMREDGGRGEADAALALGLGTRLLPTWLSAIVLRVDASRLVLPEAAWFTQVGLTQYF